MADRKTEPPCPVCASLSLRHAFDLKTSRGVRQWTRCPDCRSYSDCQAFDLENEVSHTRKWPWGNIERRSATKPPQTHHVSVRASAPQSPCCIREQSARCRLLLWRFHSGGPPARLLGERHGHCARGGGVLPQPGFLLSGWCIGCRSRHRRLFLGRDFGAGLQLLLGEPDWGIAGDSRQVAVRRPSGDVRCEQVLAGHHGARPTTSFPGLGNRILPER